MYTLPRPTAPQRFLSLLLVALLHALLLFAVLHFMVTSQTSVTTASQRLMEMIISTAPQPIPVPAPVALKRPKPAGSPLPRGGVTSGVAPSYSPAVPAPDVSGLGQAIFGCAPENIPDLTPDQRAHCINGLTRPDDNTLAEPHSHVKDPARREAEMQTKNTPGRVPCTSISSAPAPPFGSTPAPMVDPICVIGGLINGFGPLNGLQK
jgi:hypothetical protein